MKPFFRRLLMNSILIAIILVLTGCARPQEIEISSLDMPSITGRIYIGGEVLSPGYYPLKDGDTITLLVQAAGGTTSGASPTEIKLYVSQTKNEPQRIDINRADLWLIQALPGIGETLSKRIIDYRTKNGPFRSINELTRVEGIGTATFEKVRDLVTVSD